MAGLSEGIASHLLLLRRFLWILAFAFWMGGFSFYGGVVIPIGAKVVAGGEGEFGFITRQVTQWLNLIGVIALVIFLVNLLLDGSVLSRRWRRIIAVLWGALVLVHGSLIAVHSAMDRLLVPATMDIHERPRFQRLHTLYLGLSTLEWAGSLLLLAVTLWTWRLRDRAGSAMRSVDAWQSKKEGTAKAR